MTDEPPPPACGPAGRHDTAEPGGQAREVLRLFDAKAATWSAKYVPDGPLAGRLAYLSAAVSCHARAGDRVLDLGCGTGELARTLAAAGLQVAGCDISRHMLVRAARTGGACHSNGCARWVRLAPGWQRLPFESAVFDLVVAASVLEYVAEPAAVLRECARVLRPGGVVLYTVPDLRHPVRWAEWLAHRLAKVMRAPSGGGRRSRWRGYHAYLRASRQRHRARWWQAASGTAGLRLVPFPAEGRLPALRLMAFRRADDRTCEPLAPLDDGLGVLQ
jgi:ubiquinone/menaquinone biosynthesis C-methylase UbiE